MSEFRRLGPKLIRRTGVFGTADHPVESIAHWCPACRQLHDFAVDEPLSNGARWTFNGCVDRPTFHASMRIRTGHLLSVVCHYWIEAGHIRFCGDCSHSYANRLVLLPDIPDTALAHMREIPT